MARDVASDVVLDVVLDVLDVAKCLTLTRRIGTIFKLPFSVSR